MKRILFLGIFFSLFSLSATWQKEDVQLLKDCIGRDFGMFSKGAKNLKQAQDVNDFQYEHGKEVLNETKEEFLKKYQSDFIENKDNQAILYMIQGFSSEVEERFVNCTEDVEKEHAQKKEHLKRLDAMAKIVAYKVKEELKKENIYFGGWTEPKMYLLLTKRSWIINEALNDIDSTNFENVLDRLDAIDSAEEDYINMQDTQNLIERLKIKIAEQKEKSYWIPSWGI